eukprot:Nitzschia sp. Nitz4//scaffold307_size21646//9898//11282//NITZ4_008597-RA/size21646-snap-gene-0.2-mRNA-1//1//CDS//3329547136//2204//frame0
MVFPFNWSGSAALQNALKVEHMQKAEEGLLNIARKYFAPLSSPNAVTEIEAFDTKIPASALPFRKGCSNNGDELIIHGVKVTDPTPTFMGGPKSEYPLVTLHGYFNGGAYFYRNVFGLASYYGNVFALDKLGWGLSSRPDFSTLPDTSVETTESVFVESLEQWRKANNIEKMVLCGHSMGGYMSVAYCEKYPERVERLLLLSPVGVPDETDPSFQERRERMSATWRLRTILGVVRTLFEVTTVGSVLRTMGETRARDLVYSYVHRRLPEISDPHEVTTLSEYLFHNATLPGSGEHGIRVLNSNIMARKPLRDRIPNLQVPSVCFMYGQTDWMDISAALSTQKLCEQKEGSPKVEVYMVKSAGHLLMLQNPAETNSILIHAGGGKIPTEKMPILMKPGKDNLPDSALRAAALANAPPHPSDDTTPQIVI